MSNLHNPTITFHSELIKGGTKSVGAGKTFQVPYFSHIDGNLWTGAMPRFRMPDFFTSVLNLYPWESYPRSASLDYKEMEIYDSSDVGHGAFHEATDWIHERIGNGPLLVHCQAGINRSPTVAALYMMRTKGMTGDEAIALIREKRSPLALANESFRDWLRNQPVGQSLF